MAVKRRAKKKTDKDAYFLDASVLMYAAGGPHPLRELCRTTLELAVTRRVRLVSSSEVLQEILHRYFSIGRPDAARTVYRAATTLCADILAIDIQHTNRALELLLESPQLSPRDAVHVATMESHGLRRILTTDRDFDSIESVDRIEPADFVSERAARTELLNVQRPTSSLLAARFVHVLGGGEVFDG